jgi:ribosome assembly protein 1
MSTEQVVRAITTGFEISVSSGPLCEEPMMGVCFIVEAFEEVRIIEEAEQDQKKDKNKSDTPNKQELQKEDLEEMQLPQEKPAAIQQTTLYKDSYGPISGQVKFCHARK